MSQVPGTPAGDGLEIATDVCATVVVEGDTYYKSDWMDTGRSG